MPCNSLNNIYFSFVIPKNIFKGHCTNKRKPSGIIIVVGASNYSKEQGVRHTVLLIAVHPDFDVIFNFLSAMQHYLKLGIL